MRDTIQRLRDERNMTILISSHILEELSKIATDYGIIHNGSLLQELTSEELMKRCSERIEIELIHPSRQSRFWTEWDLPTIRLQIRAISIYLND